jgi:hypothetical protein
MVEAFSLHSVEMKAAKVSGVAGSADCCRRLLIYCSTGLCHHSATVDADRWPDKTAVRDLCQKAVCTKCGIIGADVRPDWTQRPRSESLTGAHDCPAWQRHTSICSAIARASSTSMPRYRTKANRSFSFSVSNGRPGATRRERQRAGGIAGPKRFGGIAVSY